MPCSSHCFANLAANRPPPDSPATTGSRRRNDDRGQAGGFVVDGEESHPYRGLLGPHMYYDSARGVFRQVCPGAGSPSLETGIG